MTNKVVKDGTVAVLYSPGYGAGWYTWNGANTDCLFDPDIVALVLANRHDEIDDLAKTKWPDMYLGGSENLKVEWVPVGSLFKIREYDGSERVEIMDIDDGWIQA